MKEKHRVLFVDRKNMVRGPITQKLMETKSEIISQKEGLENNLSVDSAGLEPAPYLSPPNIVNIALEKRGYKRIQHVVKIIDYQLQIKSEWLKSQDLILCFTNREIEDLFRKYKGLEGIVYTLPAFAGFPNEEVKHLGKLMDHKNILDIYIQLIKTIDMYVDKALERMRSEGLILRPIKQFSFPFY